MDGDWERPANVVLGHEGAAIVEAVGPDVPRDSSREGDLVVLAWTAPCGNCAACRRIEPWLCTEPRGSGHRLRAGDVRLRRVDGTPIGAYSGIGTFGERQVVAHEAAIPIDPGTPPELAALIGCAVTTGFGAVVNTARVRAGESVVVIGAGGVGLSAVMAARFADAGVIAAIDRSELRPSEVDTIGDLTEDGADHVIEAIGLTETVEQAIELVRPGGTVTLVGMTPQGQRASFDVYRLVEDGKQIRGSNCGSATPEVDFRRIAALYAEGRLPLDLLITERIALDGVPMALDAMRAGDGARRVVVY
ncbi:MAG: zinc-binding dehydrogenase [Chloroflexi bacterium]|nr:zinc-binding dehydrogenase [Chloroflexota bacterium]